MSIEREEEEESYVCGEEAKASVISRRKSSKMRKYESSWLEENGWL